MSRVRRTLWITFIVILFISAVSVTFAPVQAQTDVNDALKEAISFLAKKLGKPISAVDTYTYESKTFADASLDCPQPDKVYSPGVVTGYRFVMTLGGVSYDVRISTDYTIGVLCNDSTLKQPGTLAVYRSAQFSIAYPDGWRIVDRQTDIFFGLGANPICSQPGMTVTSLGAVGDKTADKLLDDYKLNPNATNAVYQGERTKIGPTGLSTLFVAPCADGSARQSRITIFVAFGKAYRVWQFVPQSAYDQWGDIFLKVLDEFSPAAASASGGDPMSLPNKSPLALIAHIFGGNVYIGALTDLPGKAITTDAASDHSYRNVAISPTGTALAFSDPSSGNLYIASAKGGQPQKIAANVMISYPPAWNADGSQIAYISAESAGVGAASAYAIMAVGADGNGAHKIGDTQPMKGTCDNRTQDPAEQLYWSTTGINGNSPLFIWARNRIIYYSLGCEGVGVGQLAEDGTKGSVVNPDIRRARLSTDGGQLLGVKGDGSAAKLVRFSLGDGGIAEITTAAPPDQVAWSPDGKAIYYSTAVGKKTLKLDDDGLKERGLRAFGVWPFQTTIYDVSLHSIDVASGTDTPIFTNVGRAIVNIAPSPDGSGVLFSLLQDASNLVEGFQNNVSSGNMFRAAPSSLLYWLPVPGGVAQLVAVTLDPEWGPLGSASAPTPTGDPKNRPTFGPAKAQPTIDPSLPTVEASE